MGILIKEVWLDGAKRKGEKDMEYFYEYWFSLIHQLQPGCVIFSDGCPDTRWVGDEIGVAGSTYLLVAFQCIQVEEIDMGRNGLLQSVMSIRHGWFWHASELQKSAILGFESFWRRMTGMLFLRGISGTVLKLVSLQSWHSLSFGRFQMELYCLQTFRSTHSIEVIYLSLQSHRVC